MVVFIFCQVIFIHSCLCSYIHSFFLSPHVNHKGLISASQTTMCAVAFPCTDNTLTQDDQHFLGIHVLLSYSCPRGLPRYSKQESENCSLLSKYSPPPNFINKVLLKHNVRLFTYCLWLLFRNHMAHKPKYLIYGPLQKTFF